ncbi:MAG TPA: hypothetical protein PKM97_13280 [Bacteroidia bacterium]|nr:hypothetical protein [Bacteroidia bacterium]
MKKTLLGLSAIVFLTLFSCMSGEEKKAKEPEATIPADSTLMMLVRFQVPDFNKFYSVYDTHDSLRAASGISRYLLALEMEDTTKVIIAEKIESIERAKEFGNSEVLKAAMQELGFSGPPSFEFINVIRNDDSPLDIKTRVMVKHRVKDFDAWLKVYDDEGMKARAENGMIDRGLARGAEDPNMVYIIFAISDMDKAMARSSSPELKATMLSAGVEGEPEIVMYNLQ